MNIIEHLKLFHRNLFIILVCVLASAATASFLINRLNSEPLENSLFVSISVQDKQGATNAYENLQAADQITESVQGWLKDPSLQAEINNKTSLDYSIRGKRQEKNNLLINFASSSPSTAQQYSYSIIETLNQRLQQYSRNSDLNFYINAQPLHSSESPSRAAIYLILSTLAGLILGYSFSWLFELITGKINSLKQFKAVTGISHPFQFSSDKKLKRNYKYLLAYLNQQYQDQKIQLLDLSHKSKVGLEVISKHGQFKEVKSYNLPEDLEKINLALPTIIIAELGHTQEANLKDLLKLQFNQVEAIIFDHVKN